MSDDPGWLDTVQPFLKALSVAGGVGAGSVLWWLRDWWRKRHDDREDEEDRREKARQAAIDSLDEKARVFMDRLEADNKLLRAERDHKDAEIATLRWITIELRGHCIQARQVAESAQRLSGTPLSVWADLPSLERGP